MFNKELEVTLHKASADQLKPKPDQNSLGFGQFFTDHMFTMRWNRRQGWHDAVIEPYRNFELDPAAMVFHYGQAIFEGMKAYRSKDDQIFLFRPADNFTRMNQSALRICMPRFPQDRVLQALRAMVYLDQEWVPKTPGATLYIRPTMIATEPALGLRPAEEYLFFIICCPVGAYYAEGFAPTRIYVEDQYVRAVPGGVGNAKTAGNYAASVKAQVEAHDKGYTQVLWLDAVERRYIEEVGTSNIFFLIDGELITPPLEGSILPGITRDSVLQLARDWGYPVSERRITIDEVIAASKNGTLQESFGTGTAAVISPVGEFCYRDQHIQLNGGTTGPLAQRLFDELQAIQFGDREDPHKWRVRVG
ncbi:branched chain amino acid aminotransferase apoenzyme [Desulfobulbus propionicus DSM 2032]|uniref:Branched-chain-amino-acid aminotransferase n=1 Tax=Desulfobulbus propionicus (strain ATCC 33891 / DSM 2032 / VKM B-1956 / 1pr3) TaxID=577650 RepID=A0A7U3YNW9_DESPD|nr:branched-chain amino acid aminotransferase [Desulfobulbus propionicus]ADW18827.1 branched chain amino acid aminotransferase apoenzyme [Desulfobulbus propionicus DSM 2032]